MQQEFDQAKETIEKQKQLKILNEKQTAVLRAGSFDKKDKLERIVGTKRNLKNGVIECLCEWEMRHDQNNKPYFPLRSYVPRKTLYEAYPDKFIAYIEYSIKFFGSTGI